MSLAKFDRFVPVYLIFLGLIAAGGTAGLGVYAPPRSRTILEKGPIGALFRCRVPRSGLCRNG